MSDPTLEDWAQALLAIRDEKNQLTVQEREIEAELAKLVPYGGCMVEGVGRLRVRTKKSRTQWDKDALRSAVLDSRLIDTDTGEVADESPLDKVLHVFPLGVPRSTALEARTPKIDQDEFCTVEPQGKTVQIQRDEDAPWV